MTIAPSSEVRARLARVARLIADHRDVLAARVWDDAVPEALEARGWGGALLAISDEALVRHECEGASAPWPTDGPSSLLTLALEVRAVTTLDRLTDEAPIEGALRRGETARKRLQIEAFARVARPVVAAAERIVDVGSGHGHLTREIARAVGRSVVGLERDPVIARRARALSDEASVTGAPGVSFRETDALATDLDWRSADALVGLHACGELGDAIVDAAASSGAAVVLVGCCLQKRRDAERAPFAATDDAGVPRASITLPRSLLGLSNLTARPVGVERSREDNVEARRTRLVVRRLLMGRGVNLAPGAELEGLNRRAAHLGAEALAARVLTRRGLALPSRSELAEAERWATNAHARARRLSLPRALLARAIEVLVLYDRALHLERAGHQVEVGTVFSADASARNLGLVATPKGRATRGS